MKPGTSSLARLTQQLRALRIRVSHLEQALKAAKRKREKLSPIADRRDRAESEARHKALTDYHRRQKLETLRSSPWLLELEQRLEDERNEFLMSRGLPPDSTEIPNELRRQARGLVAKHRSHR